MNFSVLMSVYIKESPDFLDGCLASIASQTRPPSEVIIVEDGPLSNELAGIIENYRQKLPIISLKLQYNVGLGEALNRGLQACSHELVARMDTDDYCCPDRFEKQLEFFSHHTNTDVLGGAIEEFNHDPEAPHAIRALPCGSENVARFARSRCPVNHMTVMFKKSSIIEAGGYQSFLGLEDYYLWARLLKKGRIMDNIPDVLVKARVGNGMLTRRRGWSYFKQDIRLQKKFLDIGFINKKTFILNLIKRAPVRLMPEKIISVVYSTFLRKKPQKSF